MAAVDPKKECLGGGGGGGGDSMIHSVNLITVSNGAELWSVCMRSSSPSPFPHLPLPLFNVQLLNV